MRSERFFTMRFLPALAAIAIVSSSIPAVFADGAEVRAHRAGARVTSAVENPAAGAWFEQVLRERFRILLILGLRTGAALPEPLPHTDGLSDGPDPIGPVAATGTDEEDQNGDAGLPDPTSGTHDATLGGGPHTPKH